MTSIFSHPVRYALAAVLTLGTTSVAIAQEATTGPPSNVRMRIGPIYLNPTMALSNAGIDDNVFNEAKSDKPKSDYTVTVSPKTDLWLRLGPSWFTLAIREDIVYYQKNASERSANNSYAASWTMPLNRITLVPSASYQNTRERPGFEVDTRAPRAEIVYGGQVNVKALSKTTLAFRVDRHQTVFEEGASFLNVSLHDELNRTSTTESVSIRHQPSLLTTLSIDIGRTQERYVYQHLRDSDSTSIAGAIRFDPAALIKGGASIGWEEYRPADPSIPGFSGTTATINLSYVFVSITKVAATLQRQIQDSYDINQPYYVQTGGSMEIGQQLFGPLDIVGRGGLQQLDYRNRVGAVVLFPNRIDHVVSYGVGIGYHLGKDMRIGINVDQSNRESAVASHAYAGLRYGVSVTYGGS